MNITFKINYTINRNISIYFETNFNLFSKHYVLHIIDSKIIYKKEHIEIFDINSNPNTTITDINEANIDLYPYTYNNFFPRSVFEASSDLSKLIYAQIGLRYTFGKKEKKE